jgi:hypothetical protein
LQENRISEEELHGLRDDKVKPIHSARQIPGGTGRSVILSANACLQQLRTGGLYAIN